MFLHLNTRMKALFIVVIEYRHRFLRDDWSGVHPLIHKMDGYSTHFCPVSESVRHRMRAGESRQTAPDGYSGFGCGIFGQTREAIAS